jgi:hypothetical protein
MKNNGEQRDHQHGQCRQQKRRNAQARIVWKYIQPFVHEYIGHRKRDETGYTHQQYKIPRDQRHDLAYTRTMIFLMLISFWRCCVVNAIRPSNPRQVMSMVSIEKAVKILPLFWSAAYWESKSWSRKV